MYHKMDTKGSLNGKKKIEQPSNVSFLTVNYDDLFFTSKNEFSL